MPEMSFASSRGGAPVSLSRAMAQGLAPDGGLYVPCEMPTIDVQALPARSSLPEIARLGLGGFFAADGLRDELAAIADAALNIPAPTTPVGALFGGVPAAATVSRLAAAAHHFGRHFRRHGGSSRCSFF